MNGSCHIWMSHVTYEWVMSYMNESCHICMSHTTYEWVMSIMNESCHIWMSHTTYEWVMSHMNESCHISTENTSGVALRRPTACQNRARQLPGRVASSLVCAAACMDESCHIWMSHVTYEWVMSRMNTSTTRTSRIFTRLCSSMYEWVMSHMNESYNVEMSNVTYEWVNYQDESHLYSSVQQHV